MFAKQYYEFDCNIGCHRHFLVIYSLIYRLGYYEETVNITLLFSH